MMMIIILLLIIIIAELHAREARLSIRTDAGGGGKGVRSQPVVGGVCYS